MSKDPNVISRRNALKCMAYGGAGTLFVLAGGVLTPVDLASAANLKSASTDAGTPLFVQISDTHIGFNKDANPDVSGTLAQTIQLVNAMPQQPRLIIHTGDITHLSKAAEFDVAQQFMSQLRTTEIHTVPGEHDTADPDVTEYFSRFGKASKNKGYYSFDHSGVHFMALVNVLQFKPGGLGTLGAEQLAWIKADLRARSASTPIVVFAHMPLWTIHEPWGWGTGDAEPLMTELRRFGSVTILNGHIHQIVQKVEGNITYHTARSTAYPQPIAGVGAGPGPLKVPTDQLAQMLGVTSVSVGARGKAARLNDVTLASSGAAADDGARARDAAAPAAAAMTMAAPRATAAATKAAEILIKDFMFAPMTLEIPRGSTVTWTNQDDEPHTVVSPDRVFHSGALDTGQSFSFKFDQAGTYRFLCSIHPRMLGSIVVT